MRILWVKAGKLLPVDTGGKIRSYNIMRRLSERHELTFLSYYGGKRDVDYEREIREQMPGALVVYTAARDETTLDRMIEYARRLPAAAPFGVTKFTSPEIGRMLDEMLNNGSFDVAVCDFLGPTLNFPTARRTPVVLFQHNIESMLWQRHARHASNPVKRVAWKIEAFKMLKYERAAIGRFDHVIAVSDFDMKMMQELNPSVSIGVVPTGVDLEQYRGSAGESPSSQTVVFLGSMDWEANIDGMTWFCGEIWPLIKQAVPVSKLQIVGRNPDSRIRNLESSDIEVTGRVESVVGYLREAAVFIVPLRIGGGTRLKIYEAMAMRKAVVSTTVGAEGLDVEHGRDILLADDPQSFAGSVIDLLTDRPRRMLLEQAAADKAARYDWAVVTDRFEEALRQTAFGRQYSGEVIEGAALTTEA